MIFPILTLNASLPKAEPRTPLPELDGGSGSRTHLAATAVRVAGGCPLERRVQQALRGLSIANLHVGTREVRKQYGGNSILGGTDVYHAGLHFMVSLY